MHLGRTFSGAEVLALILLTASLLSFGSAASADWLVTNDGTTIETQGTWEVSGNRVIFTSPTGVLSSLALSEVNLPASEAHTQAMARAAEGDQEVEEVVKPRAVMVLTDADVRHVDPAMPEAEEVVEGTETSPSPRSRDGSLVVAAWEEELNIDDNSMEIVGSLRNSGQNPVTSISLSVLLYSDSGALLGKREARLARAALSPGESTNFVASFSSSVVFSEARFDIQSRGFRNRESAPATEEGEPPPEGS